jgi:alpha-2-macroglobulin
METNNKIIKSALLASISFSILFMVGCGFINSKGNRVTTDEIEGYGGFPSPKTSLNSLGVSTDGGKFNIPAFSKIPVDVLYSRPWMNGNIISPVVVVFNQPMFELGKIKAVKNSKDSPIYTIPKTHGQWRWIAGDTLKFEFNESLKNATRYKVIIKKGVSSLGGTKLAKDYTWSFETPKPKVNYIHAKTEHEISHNHLHSDDYFSIDFNQKVDPRLLKKSITLKQNGKLLPFKLVENNLYKKSVYLFPLNLLTAGSSIVVKVKKGFLLSEGPLKGEDGKISKFKVQGDFSGKLSHSSLSKSKKLSPFFHNLSVEFTEPVDFKELLNHLVIRPKLKKGLHARVEYNQGCSYKKSNKKACAYHFYIDGKLKPGARYTVKVKRGLKDINGRVLGKDLKISFKVGVLPSGLFLPDDAEAMRENFVPYRFKYTNLKSLTAKYHPLDGKDLIKFISCVRKWKNKIYDSDQSVWEKKPNSRTWFNCIKGKASFSRKINLGGKKNKIIKQTMKIPLGAYAVELKSPTLTDRLGNSVPFHRFFLTSNFAIQTTLSPFGITVWATSLKKGKPVKGASITLYDKKGNSFGSGKTDKNGIFKQKRGAVSIKKWSKDLFVVANKGKSIAYTQYGDVRYVGETPNGYTDNEESQYEEEEDYQSSEDSLYEFRSDLKGIGRVSWYLGPVQTGYISTERGVYRKGHTVYIHGAVRKYRFMKDVMEPLPAKGPVKVVLRDNSGNDIITKEISLESMGVFSTKMVLPLGAALGNWSVLLKLKNKQIATYSFKVKDYKEPKFEASIFSNKREYLNSETVKLNISGRYFFGGAMGGAAYRLSIKRYIERKLFRGAYRGYFAGAAQGDVLGSSKKWHFSKGVLDKRGGRKREILFKKPSPWYASHLVEAEVSSTSLRTVAVSRYLFEHPAKLYPAVKIGKFKNNHINREVAVLTHAGKPVKGTRIRVRLFKTRKNPEVKWGVIPDRTKILFKSWFNSGKIQIKWPKWVGSGCVFVEYEVRDNEGKLAKTLERTCFPRWLSSSSTKNKKKEKVVDSKFKVVLDKESYKVGETAIAIVTSKNALKNIIMYVERERTFETHPIWLNSKGVAKVKLIVKKEYYGGVRVRIVGIERGKNIRKNNPLFLQQSTTLYVDTDSNDLTVGISTDKKVYKPGEKVEVSIDVNNALDKPHLSKVVIMAVDEAVLRLTGFRLPDPGYSLDYQPPHMIASDDSRRHLLNLRIPVVFVNYNGDVYWGYSGYGMGGGGGGGGGSSSSFGVGYGRGGRSGKKTSKPRKKFLTCAWHTTVVTGKDGKATVSFTLPDNITRFRLMAFAVDSYRGSGTGSNYLRVEKNLISMPSLPRFLRTGDVAQTGVSLYWQGKAPLKSNVRLELSGKAVALMGKKNHSLILEPGNSKKVTFSLRGVRAGQGNLKFIVTAKGQEDILEIPLTVQKPVVSEAVSVSGHTKTAVRQGIKKLTKLNKNFGGLNVILSSTALTGIEDGMEQLVQYPYGCIEQRTSKLLPMIGLLTMGNRFTMPLPKNIRKYVESGLREILTMQTPSGGFSYWMGGESVYAWNTAYVLIMFKRLKEAGISVPKGTIKRALKFLKQKIKGNKTTSYWYYSQSSLIAYAISLYGELNKKMIMELFNKRKHRPLFARAMVLLSLSRMKKSKTITDAMQRLVLEIGNSLRIEGDYAHVVENLGYDYQTLMHSSGRSTAMVLMALLAAKPDHPMVPRLVRYFLKGRKNGRFRNTQEAGWALLSMMDYAKIKEKDIPDFEAGVWLGKKQIIKSLFRKRSLKPKVFNMKMGRLLLFAQKSSQDLIFAKRGKGRLYYTARLRYARKTLPKIALNQGFAISRKVQVMSPSGVPGVVGEIPKYGDTVLVTLKVKSSEPHSFVVLEDPIPAGMEAIDTSFATSSKSFGSQNLKSSYYNHRELRDDKVLHFIDKLPSGSYTFSYLLRVTTKGIFVSPPARGEEMYNPEVFGYNPIRHYTIK